MKFFIIIIPFIYNYIYLFNRKSKIFKVYRKWLFPFLCILLGLLYVILPPDSNGTERTIEIWAFFTPFIFTIYLSLSSLLSKYFNHRDFILYLRYSDEIDYLKPKKSNAKSLDKFISYFSIFFILFLPFIILLFKK